MCAATNVAYSTLWSLFLFHCPINGIEIYIKLKQTRKNSVKNRLSKFILLKKKVVDINNNNNK